MRSGHGHAPGFDPSDHRQEARLGSPHRLLPLTARMSEARNTCQTGHEHANRTEHRTNDRPRTQRRETMTETDYRRTFSGRATRLAKSLAIGGALLLLGAIPGFAQTATVFSGGEPAGKSDGYTTYEYNAAPFPVTYNDTLYLYGTAADGKGYYTTYDGSQWTAYTGWDDQPTTYKWQPTSVSNAGKQYLFYTGQDNKIYHDTYDGQAWSGWEDISGAYTYAEAPYANNYGDSVYLYAPATDGNVYYKSWAAGGWTEWAAVNDGNAAKACQPYSLEWVNTRTSSGPAKTARSTGTGTTTRAGPAPRRCLATLPSATLPTRPGTTASSTPMR